jgi:hypothetical protein
MSSDPCYVAAKLADGDDLGLELCFRQFAFISGFEWLAALLSIVPEISLGSLVHASP